MATYKQADHAHSPMKFDSDVGLSPVFSSSGVAQATNRGVRGFTGSFSMLKNPTLTSFSANLPQSRE